MTNLNSALIADGRQALNFFAVRLKALIAMDEALQRVGSLEQAAEEAERRAANAQSKMDAVQRSHAAVLEKAKSDQESVRASTENMRQSARADAAKIIAEAQRQAQDIKDAAIKQAAASMENSQRALEAKNAEIVKAKDDLDTILGTVDKHKRELAEAEQATAQKQADLAAINREHMAFLARIGAKR